MAVNQTLWNNSESPDVTHRVKRRMDCMLLSCYIHVLKWIYTLQLNKCQGAPWSEQAHHVKFKWQKQSRDNCVLGTSFLSEILGICRVLDVYSIPDSRYKGPSISQFWNWHTGFLGWGFQGFRSKYWIFHLGHYNHARGIFFCGGGVWFWCGVVRRGGGGFGGSYYSGGFCWCWRSFCWVLFLGGHSVGFGHFHDIF